MALHKLTPAFVNRARSGRITKARRYGDGGGLYLKVSGGGSASWVFTYATDGRTTLMGGGRVADVSLRQAREWAGEQRRLRATGHDPLAARDRKRQQTARGLTFSAAAHRYVAAFEPSWRNPKHRQQWRNTLATYAYPTFGQKPIAAVDTADVVRMLTPIWSAKPETASRLRGRVEAILDWAKAQGLRDGDNPARWRGHIALILPRKGKVRRVRHHAALGIDEIAGVWANLANADNMSALATAFCIVTALRPGAVRSATWDEVDLKSAMWTIGADRMKTAREHRVPLSPEAIAILERAGRWRRASTPLVFPGGKKRAPLSLASLSKALKAAGGGDATVHGSARSAFSDWAHERTNHPNEVIEMALAHIVRSTAERAYRRGDLFEKRRQLMSDWGRHLGGH
jgi:integrase